MRTTMTKKITKIMAAALTSAAITVSAGAMSVSAIVAGPAHDMQVDTIGICQDSSGTLYKGLKRRIVSLSADQTLAKAVVRSVADHTDKDVYYINSRKITRKETYDNTANKLGKKYDHKGSSREGHAKDSPRKRR